ncbi:MAG: MBL fold metallo-hydrolase [Candidatus Bathyarchaeota archaeon]|nr:MBL fold metallo-hydrolase [Candidatus Bathyarchaeota archaeon]
MPAEGNPLFSSRAIVILIRMLIETFTVGMLATNCYIASCKQTKEAIIIDPGLDLSAEAEPIMEYITEAKLKVKFIVNTHGHSDHVKGNAIFQEKYGVPIYIHTLDAPCIASKETTNAPANVLLEEGSLITFGTETLRVMHTPGHTPGSISLVGDKLVFTGDTLFAGGIGRTDFAEGSMSDMRLSLQKLVCLPDYLLVYPGHGETTMIGEEKRVNPFLNNRSESVFF